MPKLNDAQLILLSTASQRDDRSFYPLPATLDDAGDRAAKAISALTKSGFAEERETSNTAGVHRVDDDIRYGMFITEAGIKAIDGGEGDNSVPRPATAAKPERQSKSAAVVALLHRNNGATLAELIEATGWLPHTTRAALTGLRKKGHTIKRSKRGEETCYSIAATA